jgi:hypothetical protein
MRVALVGTMMLLLQSPEALAQGCIGTISCSPEPRRFAGCSPSSLEQPQSGRIGIVGRARILDLAANCRGRVAIEVIKSSEEVAPQIVVEYDPCERWGAHEDKIVDFYVWQNARIRTGSQLYEHAPCPR